MSHDRFVSPRDDPFDSEEMHQFWDAALGRFKAYVEAAESGGRPVVDATQDSPPLIPLR